VQMSLSRDHGHKGDSLDETKPPLPPFTPDAARHKVRLAEAAWNTRDPTAWCSSTQRCR